MPKCDRICQKGCIETRHSTVIQGNSFGVLFNGLLAELPFSTILQLYKVIHLVLFYGLLAELPTILYR